MHTDVYAVYASGCSLSVTCQVAMAGILREVTKKKTVQGNGEEHFTDASRR